MVFHIAVCSPDAALRSGLERQCMEYFARRQDACIVQQLPDADALLRRDTEGERFDLYLIELGAVAAPAGLSAAAELRRRGWRVRKADNQVLSGIRLTARQILLDAHAANNVNFQTDYDRRVEKIGAVVDGCSLLLEYLTICTEEGIISAKKAGIWTKKVTDVKYPAMKWLTSERGRAEKLRAEAERKRLTEQAAALKAVLYPEP